QVENQHQIRRKERAREDLIDAALTDKKQTQKISEFCSKSIKKYPAEREKPKMKSWNP
ncbi:hypothetical protein TNIN_368961, partial [Trichonephila inaurata madagascariensis]